MGVIANHHPLDMRRRETGSTQSPTAGGLVVIAGTTPTAPITMTTGVQTRIGQGRRKVNSPFALTNRLALPTTRLVRG